MGIFDELSRFVEHLGEKFKKLDENPLVNHAIDWFGDFVMGKMFIKHEVNGKTKREIDPKWLRVEAPRLFARTRLDENLLREIVYSKHLEPGYRVALFDNWGPDLSVSNPDPALGQVGPNQWDDIRLTLVEEMFKQDGSDLVLLQGTEREAKIKELCEFLTELAKISNTARLNRFVCLRYCRSRETDYKIVKFQHWRQRVIATVDDLWQELADWLTDPGPTGFRAVCNLLQRAANTAAPAVRGSLDSAAASLNRRADDINRGTRQFGQVNTPAVNLHTNYPFWFQIRTRVRTIKFPNPFGMFIR